MNGNLAMFNSTKATLNKCFVFGGGWGGVGWGGGQVLIGEKLRMSEYGSSRNKPAARERFPNKFVDFLVLFAFSEHL